MIVWRCSDRDSCLVWCRVTKKTRKGPGTPGGPKTPPDPAKLKERQEKLFEDYIRRISSPAERPYFRDMLREFIKNNVLDMELLEHIPMPPAEVGKSRFDQLYSAALALAFPGYREETLERLLGPTFADRPGTKIWRCIFPEKFGLTHVLIRACSFQEAFALAADYSCRLSLRMYRRIPVDLTIRVLFVSEKALRRQLDMRWANRVKKRKQLQMEGREFTSKEVTGARLAALGHNLQHCYDIFHYAEARDLRKILKQRSKIRVSSVETETFQDGLPDEYLFRHED